MAESPNPRADQRTTARIAIVTVSDRASRGEYEDKGGPAAEDWLREVITSPLEITREIVPDGREGVAATLRKLADGEGADLILITGGTGPAPRDETPEALADVIEKELPGSARRCAARRWRKGCRPRSCRDRRRASATPA